jgi:hypothetical protein
MSKSIPSNPGFATPESLKSPAYTPAQVIQQLMTYKLRKPETSDDIELNYLAGPAFRSHCVCQDWVSSLPSSFDATESEDSKNKEDGSESDDETSRDGDEIFFDAVTDQEPSAEDPSADAPAEINADEFEETAGGDDVEEEGVPPIETLWDNF